MQQTAESLDKLLRYIKNNNVLTWQHIKDTTLSDNLWSSHKKNWVHAYIYGNLQTAQ